MVGAAATALIITCPRDIQKTTHMPDSSFLTKAPLSEPICRFSDARARVMQMTEYRQSDELAAIRDSNFVRLDFTDGTVTIGRGTGILTTDSVLAQVPLLDNPLLRSQGVKLIKVDFSFDWEPGRGPADDNSGSRKVEGILSYRNSWPFPFSLSRKMLSKIIPEIKPPVSGGGSRGWNFIDATKRIGDVSMPAGARARLRIGNFTIGADYSPFGQLAPENCDFATSRESRTLSVVDLRNSEKIIGEKLLGVAGTGLFRERGLAVVMDYGSNTFSVAKAPWTRPRDWSLSEIRMLYFYSEPKNDSGSVSR